MGVRVKVLTISDPVQWHEGMLLTPQHFQQSDLRWQQLARYYLSVGCPFYWGIVHMEIDKVLLVGGLFRVMNLEAVLPDGTRIHVTPSDELQADLTGSVDKIARTPLTVYLALPAHQDSEPNTSGDFPRFRSVMGPPILDLNTGVGEVLIPRLRPQAQLVLGDTLPPRYVGIPLARVYFEEDAYALSPFLGPQLSVNLDQDLGQMVAQLARRTREKLAYLGDKMQGSAMANRKENATEAEGIFRSLASGLLAVEALLAPQVTHPYTLYVGLCAMASHLSTVRFGQVPPVFDAYNHNDPLYSYGQVLEFANRMIDLVRETYAKLYFQREGRVFKIQLDPQWTNQEYIIGLRPQLGMGESELAAWMDSAVIATESFARSAADSRVLGAKRQVIEGVESMGLMASKGTLLYAVPVDPQFMQGGEELQVFNASDAESSRPQELILYV